MAQVFGEDCTYPHVTITEDLLNQELMSSEANFVTHKLLTELHGHKFTVCFFFLECYPVFAYAFTISPLGYLMNFELETL